MTKPYDLLTLGEILLRLSPSPEERLSSGDFFRKSVGGAELNVAAGASLLGLRTGILSKIPDNALGEYVQNQIQLRGVDTRYLALDPLRSARLGIYYYEYGSSPRKPQVVYDRLHTSARSMTLSDFPESVYSSARCFHTSGITLALSEDCRALSIEMIRRFKEQGALISFDVNYRSNLWSGEEARYWIEQILPLVDIFFCSEDTARLTFHKEGDAREILKSFTEDYPISIVAASQRIVHSPKCHSFGSLLYQASTDTFYQENPYEKIEVLDRIGTGDAFVAGTLYGLLAHSMDCQYAQRIGNAASALKHSVPGDLPISRLREVETLIAEHTGSASGEMVR
ncbi:MAG TPA: sugar kinase [Candidatus Limivivens merdigallinarum]|uniref:Sugar kinase n=1 Tax=Candidatus Limivivens merdigallinarum TaxID=2840859 RepID=A0A9D1D054_9FIRM|nr:sugar kinase [Candidatus Limivivens merdigallinarum]